MIGDIEPRPVKVVLSQALIRQRRTRALCMWTRAETDLSENELARMPAQLFGKGADDPRVRAWLRKDRAHRVQTFFSGKGTSPVDRPDNLRGPHRDIVRRQIRAVDRRSAIREWLNGER